MDSQRQGAMSASAWSLREEQALEKYKELH